ncbi:MAG: 50S ribosomal protein L4 [Candidatus Pacebacteria bacterium]|nr:50S ribosomal protein L4 [Candidatus Paceibacterota bacterium]
MKTDIYTQEGKKSGSIELPSVVFEAVWNKDLIHQVVVGMQANARTPIAHTKIRSEVKGGGKKPWKQKGLGKARHGSSRSPIWRGGGVTFGPRND